MSPSASLEVHADPARAGAALADRIIDGIATAGNEKRRFLLGCPGGRSAIGVYTALAERVAAEQIPISHLVIVMMDEYVLGRPGAFRAVGENEPHSCRRFGSTEIVARLNSGSPDPIPPDQLWVPDPGRPYEYEAKLRSAGGIDHFILASGSGDGHVAFNPPGSPRDSRTRVIELAEQTRRDNLLTFPTFAGLDAVPTFGVSVGIGTMIDFSAAATLVIHGAEKQDALRRILAADDYDPGWPATVVHACRHATVLTDRSTHDQLTHEPLTTSRGHH